MTNLITVKDLSVSFPSSKDKKNIINIVRNVDFSIGRKQIVGFIGESGSGKSVTAKSLLGINLNSITSAKTLDIDSISTLDEEGNLSTSKSTWKQIRGKKVAYIPQDSLTSLNPTKKIGAQIVESINLHGDKAEFKTQVADNKIKIIEIKEQISIFKAAGNKEGIKKLKIELKKYPTTIKGAMKNEAISLLEEFGIKDARQRINHYPHQFSGGMRQRVIIAMMVACKPDLIIADEPTTALDPTVQSAVMALFQDIVEKFDISIILISHDIAVIAKACDYLYVFYAGAIVEKGTKKDIFTNSKHPYTWSLLSAIPDSSINKKGEKLFTISGQPPTFDNLPSGDPFSVRNPYAMKIDYKKEPPLIKVSETHYAATWLLHPSSPKVTPPKQVADLMKLTTKDFKNAKK